MTEADRIFSRFPDFIKEFIYRNNWNELRDIQLDAAKVIFDRSYKDLKSVVIPSEIRIAGYVYPVTSIGNEAFYGCLVIGENMTYDKQSIQSYIDKHGLYTYEELAVYGVSYEQFVGANLAYLKVIVGEGIVTLEEALSILSEYVPQ